MDSMTTVNVNIDLHNRKLVTVNAKQYDKLTRYILFTCYDQGSPYTVKDSYKVYVRYRKPDGYAVFNDCTIESGKIKVELTEQMLACPGKCEGDLMITELNGVETVSTYEEILENPKISVLSTMEFCVNVIRAAIDNDIIESTPELSALNKFLENGAALEQAMKDAQNSAKAAKTSEDNAAKSAKDALASQTAAKGCADAASDSAAAALKSEQNAKTSETEAGKSKDAALASQKAAASSQTEAAASAAAALKSQNAAKDSETKASQSQTAAKLSETKAEESSSSAAQSAEEAKNSASSAAQDAVSAGTSATASEDWANKAKSWAIGEGDVSRENQEMENAKAYATQAGQSASSANADATKAETAKTGAQSAETAAETARDKAIEAEQKIENMTVSAESGDPGTPAEVEKTVDESGGNVNLHFTIPRGEPGALTDLSGVFMFQVDDKGDLYVLYDDVTEPPNFELDDNGDLYFIFGEATA